MKKLFKLLGIASVLMLAESSWGTDFERILFLKGGGYISASTAGDVNGDGYDDLITNIPDGTGNGHGGPSSIYLGPTPDSVADIILSSPVGNQYVFSAGDVNGDEYSDVGVKGGDNGVRIYLGGSIMDSLPDVIIQETLHIDCHCHGIGDFNGDGYDDIAIPFLSEEQWFTGVYFGGANMDTTRDLILRGRLWVIPEPTEIVGKNVELGGDINGNGYSDVVTILQDTANHIDTLCIYYGDSIPDNTPDVLLQVNGISSYSIAGDINGDEYSDVVVGCRFADNEKGKTYIFFGGASFDTAVDVILEVLSDTLFGLYVGSAGDINGDSFDDVLVTAKRKAYLFFGGNPMNNVVDWENLWGDVLGTAGDMNNDGRDEFFTGKYIRTGDFNPPFVEIWRCNVGIKEGKSSTTEYKFSVSPNPFIQSTTLEYSLSHFSNVSLKIHDASGRLVRTLVDNAKTAKGKHRFVWVGDDDRGKIASPGVYFCRLQTNDKRYKLRANKVISLGR